MSPSIGHPTDLAVGTWTKVTGSRRVTSLLTKGVHFCCLLRPQIASLRFPPRVPPSPFALRVCLQALCGDRVAQVAQVTVRHTVIASGPCRLGDPEQRRPALRPLGYPTDCP